MSLNQIKKAYQNIQQIGITSSLNFSERLRVELSNLVIICMSPLLFINFIIELAAGANLVEICTNFLWALVSAMPLIFNYFHKYLLARYWIVFMGTIFTGIFMLLYGKELQVEPLIIVSLVCAFYLFNGRASIAIALGVFLLYFIFVSIVDLNNAPLRDHINSSSNFTALVSSCLMIGILTYKVLTEYRDVYRQNEEQKATLQLKNEELERFAYIAAHDLKTPLRNLYSYLGLIELRYDQSSPQINEYIKSSKKSAEKLQTLIDDILSYSHLESKAIPKELIDVNSLVEELKENFINQEMTKISYKNLPRIFGDKLQLKLLFQNLIENGLKYNKNKIPEVNIGGRAVDNDIVFTFKDNGIGIEPKYQDQIFKMFTRLHSSDLYTGTGMGLAICKKIVENLDGTITVKSNKDEGTAFTITLPQETGVD